MAARRVDVRVYEELNDFLPAGLRKRTFQHCFDRDLTVQGLLAAYGIPLAAVDLILADGRPVVPSHAIRDGERIAAYPVFESLDIAPVTPVRARPLRRTRFAVLHMDPLMRLLRLLGFDALPAGGEGPAAAQGEPMILLYRAGAPLPPHDAARRYCLRAQRPRAQLVEVIERFDLARAVRPLSRCLSCNAALARSDDAGGIAGMRCPRCRRVYAPGAGWRRRMLYADRVLRSALAAK